MTENNNFYFPLTDLYFDQEYLRKFVNETIRDEHWYVFDCGKIRWTVQEEYSTDRSECTYFPRTDFFKELYGLFNIKINIADIFFSRTPPPGIPPHIDRNRPAAINIPVFGEYDHSPIYWCDSFSKKNRVAEFRHSEISKVTNKQTALLFDPKKIHAVENETDRDRCLLSFWWRKNSYGEILTMWKDGSLINWDNNKENKYIKIIR